MAVPVGSAAVRVAHTGLLGCKQNAKPQAQTKQLASNFHRSLIDHALTTNPRSSLRPGLWLLHHCASDRRWSSSSELDESPSSVSVMYSFGCVTAVRTLLPFEMHCDSVGTCTVWRIPM